MISPRLWKSPSCASRGLEKYSDLIRFVTDRPGHDRRYAIDSTRIRSELGWQPEVDFEVGAAPDDRVVSLQSPLGGAGRRRLVR